MELGGRQRNRRQPTLAVVRVHAHRSCLQRDAEWCCLIPALVSQAAYVLNLNVLPGQDVKDRITSRQTN
jgi:hypothetical protein